jgi:hypothetical protein
MSEPERTASRYSRWEPPSFGYRPPDQRSQGTIELGIQAVPENERRLKRMTLRQVDVMDRPQNV